MVTIEILNASDSVTPIADVGVWVFNETNTLILQNGRTDSLGQIAFDLANGNYNLRCMKAGINFDAEYPIVVESSDTDVPITGTIVSSVITDLDVQLVYHGQKTQDGVTLDPDSYLIATLKSNNEEEGETVLTGIPARSVWVAERNRFEMSLVKGKIYRVQGKNNNLAYPFFDKVITVTDDDVVALTDY